MRLLIVDDSQIVRNYARAYTRAAFDVVGEAIDGEDSVAKAAALEPDIILMDISMPRMDGVTAARAIRAARPDVAILFGSSLSVMERLDEFGPRAAVLHKPYMQRQLVAALRSLVE